MLPGGRAPGVRATRKTALSPQRDATIREVATDCHTAVGTVYNYFPSKEALLATALQGFAPMYHEITSVRSLG